VEFLDDMEQSKAINNFHRPVWCRLRGAIRGNVMINDALFERKQATVFVSPDTKLGKNVRLFGFNNIYGCEIGDNTTVGTFVEITRGVKIGANCKICTHTYICDGVTIGDRCFIGHNVTFTNDKMPRATTADGRLQTEADWTKETTVIEDDVSIGSGAVILCGIRIGKGALIGSGAVVTKDVEARTIVSGVPAKLVRKL
jgi:UDP-2-acetamido-3-amino-2,3-dideoxy-glucuronate N-acetyltransferase